MNDILQQIANACIPVLCLLIAAGGAYLVALLRKKTAQLQQTIDNDTAGKYMGMACDAVTQAVTYTAQTFVDALKDEDAFTKERQLEAFNKAKTTALNILGETAVLALREIYGDFEAWLDSRIEQVCREIKVPSTETTAAVTACVASAIAAKIMESDDSEQDAAAAFASNPVLAPFMRDSYK